MKWSVYAIGISLWGLANFIILEWMSEGATKAEPRLNPELIAKFEPIVLQVQTPDSKEPIPFQARLLKPKIVETGQLYPLVVSLHGAGERGSDNQRQLRYLPQQMAQSPWIDKYPCFILAPQCPRGMDWSSPADTLESTEDHDQTLLTQIQRMILNVSHQYPIDHRRIYITGYSMGGFGTWAMIDRYPDFFAAAVPICSGGNPETVSRIVHLPIWVAHGDADQIIPVARSRIMVEAIRNAGGDPVYKELAGVDHNSWSPTYADSSGMMAWLFQQRKKEKKLD